MKIKTLADLKPDSRNARKHNPRNIGMITESLGRVGAARSIVIDEDGNILAGNGTVEALAEVGIHKVKVVETDGEEIVAVMRKGLSPEQKIELALADNRTAELAEWDPVVLEELSVEIPEIIGEFFRENELDQILGELIESEVEEEVEIEFSEIMDEANNYIVLLFDNEIDWISAKTIFGLKTVSSYRTNGKPWSQGIGRVLNGPKVLEKLFKDQV